MNKNAKKETARSKNSKKAAAAKPAAGGFKQFQDLLSKKRDAILRTVKDKEVDISYGEIGDEADVASQTFEREMLFEMTNGERMILDDIEAALRKIEKGEFGYCEACHKKITGDRLRAMPWARYCIQCQTMTEAPSRI